MKLVHRTTDGLSRPYYDQAFEALQSAHQACLKSPERGILGMSHGPFSGVNVALGIVADLEGQVMAQAKLIEKLRERLNEQAAA